MTGIKKYYEPRGFAGGAAVPRRAVMDGAAVAQPRGGLWTVPLFEKYPHLIERLQRGDHILAALLMVDLSGFSDVTNSMNPQEINKFLEPFYDETVANIQNRNGIVEKFIGDAVVAVFSRLFGCGEDLMYQAYEAARDTILFVRKCYGVSVTAKASITLGTVFIGWVGPQSYSDLTVIGRPMTELFRMEAVAPKQGVIMPYDRYTRYVLPRIPRWGGNAGGPIWMHGAPVCHQLKGLGTMDLIEITYQSHRSR